MKLPSREPITDLSRAQLETLLTPHFSSKSSFSGFAIAPGWNNIVHDLHQELMENHPDYVIQQVKEKFGGLRFYIEHMTELDYSFIAEATRLSEKTCEDCGRRGKLRVDRYRVRTLCSYDAWVDKNSMLLWNFEKGGFKLFVEAYFCQRRWNAKRKKKNRKLSRARFVKTMNDAHLWPGLALLVAGTILAVTYMFYVFFGAE